MILNQLAIGRLADFKVSIFHIILDYPKFNYIYIYIYIYI